MALRGSVGAPMVGRSASGVGYLMLRVSVGGAI